MRDIGRHGSGRALRLDALSPRLGGCRRRAPPRLRREDACAPSRCCSRWTWSAARSSRPLRRRPPSSWCMPSRWCNDDVVDGSRLRRERPALWTVVGPGQAINTGDGLFGLAHQAMHRLPARGYAERRVLEAMRELTEGTRRLVEGQYLDISFEQRADVSTRDYLEMAAGKTAAMFACPFAIGALLGGAEGHVVAAFREFGARLGIAFQAVDDVLGAWGDPRVTGSRPATTSARARRATRSSGRWSRGPPGMRTPRASSPPPTPRRRSTTPTRRAQRPGASPCSSSARAGAKRRCASRPRRAPLRSVPSRGRASAPLRWSCAAASPRR